MADESDEAVFAQAVGVVMGRRSCSRDAAREYLRYMADGIDVTVADFAKFFLLAIDSARTGVTGRAEGCQDRGRIADDQLQTRPTLAPPGGLSREAEP